MRLTRTKPVDAAGKPLDPTKLYQPITSFARGHRVFNVGAVQLRGDHEAVTTLPALWVATDGSSEERDAARAAHRARSLASVEPAPPDPTAPRILQPLPPERRRVAVKGYHDKAGRWYEAGKVYDSHDPFVKANPDLFAPRPRSTRLLDR